MDARKLLRIKLRFHVSDRFSQQVRLFAHVKTHVLALGLNPVDLFGFEKEGPTAGFDQKPLNLIGPCLQLFKQHKCLPIKIAPTLCCQSGLRAGQRLFEPRPIERLYKTVDSRDLESSQRVLIVSGYEDHKRQLNRVHRFEHIEAVDLRHLDIQKQQIRFEVFYRGDGFFTVAAIAHNFNLRIAREHSPDAAPRQRLVVNDHCSGPSGCAHTITARSFARAEPEISKGIVNVTSSPPSGASDISKWCDAPY